MFLINKERDSLGEFSDFFSRAYWSFENKLTRVNKIHLDGDPINIESRQSTLRDALAKSSTSSNIPYTKLNQLNNAIFFYNMAVGSKSIENSLLLLWTSLETVLPYRIANSDIECVQHFVSVSLSLGSIGRDVFAFANRFNTIDNFNENALQGIGPTGNTNLSASTSIFFI